jgi:Tfp pilus assembly protein PilP
VNEFFFDYIDEVGVENWFGINDGRIISKIGNLCLALREKMRESGQGVWAELNFAINLRDNNFSADFEYEGS